MSEKTYKDGLEEAWAIAQKILKQPKEGYTESELDEIFNRTDNYFSHELINDYSIHEVKEKIEKWKAEKTKYKFGDVVEVIGKFGSRYKGIYLDKRGSDYQILLFSNLNRLYIEDFDDIGYVLKKTNYYFDMEEIFKIIKE